MQRLFSTAITLATTLAALTIATAAKADSLKSFCAYYPNGASRPEAAMPCTFSQRQGFVGISWRDGVYNSFEPVTDRSGVFTDRRGGLVYRQGTDGPADLIFQMEAGSIEVYWVGSY
ncbi:MAG: hypothetical protein AAFY72_11505 [Cyanobacteria bacterium J06649_4]